MTQHDLPLAFNEKNELTFPDAIRGNKTERMVEKLHDDLVYVKAEMAHLRKEVERLSKLARSHDE